MDRCGAVVARLPCNDDSMWRAPWCAGGVLAESTIRGTCRQCAVPPLFGVAQSSGPFTDAGGWRSRIMQTWRRPVWQIVKSTCAEASGWSTSPSATTASATQQRSPVIATKSRCGRPNGGHILFGRMDYDGHASLWLMETGGAPVEVCRLEISGALGNENCWFGFYGYTDWCEAFDWRRRSYSRGSHVPGWQR